MNRTKILVVEDEPDIAQAVVTRLGAEGFHNAGLGGGRHWVPAAAILADQRSWFSR